MAHGRAPSQGACRTHALGISSLPACRRPAPLSVNLELYEINPRDNTGKFVKTVTDAVSGSLKGKLQKDAPVMLQFSAKPK